MPDARPPTRLVLALPAPDDPAWASLQAGCLTDILAAGDVAAVLQSPADPLEPDELGLALVAEAQAAGAAWLIAGAPAALGPWGADGCQVAAEAEADGLSALRRALGDDLILGCDCGVSRHAALLAAEAGADYLGFDAAEPALFEWWQATMTPPCLALGAVTLENAGALAAAGADFVATGADLWADPAAMTARYQAAIAPGAAA